MPINWLGKREDVVISTEETRILTEAEKDSTAVPEIQAKKILDDAEALAAKERELKLKREAAKLRQENLEEKKRKQAESERASKLKEIAELWGLLYRLWRDEPSEKVVGEVMEDEGPPALKPGPRKQVIDKTKVKEGVVVGGPAATAMEKLKAQIPPEYQQTRAGTVKKKIGEK